MTNFLFDVKGIRQEKDRGKEKSRVDGKGVEDVFFSIHTGIERPFFGPMGALNIGIMSPNIPQTLLPKVSYSFWQ